MRNLYIYGDSFSDFYMRDRVDKFWFEILEERFNFKLVHRAISGYGWQRIKYTVFKDAVNWSNHDIIFICPSFFSRVDIIEFNVERPDSTVDSPHMLSLDTHNKREAFTLEDWYNTVSFIKKHRYNVHTWALDRVSSRYRDICIPPPVGFTSWYEWILSDPEHWVVPFPHPGGDNGVMIEKDTHLSTIANQRLAEFFTCYIKDEKI